MRKVENRKVVRRIADRTRKTGKNRSIIAILAIALTSLLFTSVFTIGGSIVEKQQEATMRQVGGSAHAGYKYLTQEEYDIVKKDKKLKEVSYRILLGDAVNESLKKLRTEISYYEDLNAKFSFCYPEEGRMPEAEDEIVTSDLVLEAMGIPCRIGEKVPVEFTVNNEKHEKTFTLCGYFKGDSISMSQIMLVSKALVNEMAPTPTNSAMGKNIDTSDYAGRIMADFNFASSFNLEGQMEELTKRCGFPEEADTGINWAYMTGSMDIQDLLPVVVILLVILVSGYLIIYNIFYINVYHDIRHYGLLKTIGTTGRQLRKIVRRQAYMLCLYGIPLGLLLGGIAGKFILPVVMKNLVFSGTTDTKVSLNIWIFILAALISLLTVYISCIKPCRIASSASPVEAVGYTEGQNKTTARKKRKKTKKVDSFHMALANMGRNRKKAVIVTASISLGLVLLNSVCSLVDGFDLDKYIAARTISDFSVNEASLDNPSVYDKVLDGVTEAFLSELSEKKGIEEICNIYLRDTDAGTMNEEERAAFKQKILDNPSAREYIQSLIGNDEETWKWIEAGGLIDRKIYGAGHLAFEKLEILEGKTDWEKFKTGKYVIAARLSISEEGQEGINYHEIGEKVTIRLEDGSSREYEVMAIGNMPYAAGLQLYGVFENNYILPDEEYLDFLGETQPMRTLINVEKGQEKSIEKWLSNYCENVNADLDFNSKASVAGEFSNMKKMYTMVGGLLAFILAMIGILNFVNTMATSVLSRKQEFAMMEAVGMTGKQLRAMLCSEGLMYALLSAIVFLVLSSVLGVTVIRSVGSGFFFYTWSFTIAPVLLCIPALILVVLVVPVVCYRSVDKVSVVERMRKTE